MTEIEALNKHKRDCKRCTGEECKYGIDCLQEKDIEVYEEFFKYRALGTVEELKEVKEKQIAKKPIFDDERSFIRRYHCPECKCVVDAQRYCHHCGQKLDWGNEDDRTD